MKRRLPWWGGLWIGLVACSQQAASVPIRALERSGQVAFACRGGDGASFLPLSECDLERARSEASAPRPLAFVSQVARGQVAAVDLAAGKVLDADPRIPGYSFATVAEAPSGLAIPPTSPRALYLTSSVAPLIEAHPLDRMLPGGGVHERLDVLPLPSAASGLQVDATGRLLLAPLPDAGSVVLVPIEADGSLGAPETVLLPGDDALPDVVDLRVLDALPVTASPTSFERICPPSGASLPVATLGAPGSLASGAPRPQALAWEPSGVEAPTISHAWVADPGLGAVHKLHVDASDPAASNVELSIRLGVAVEAVAVTPMVPAFGADGTCVPARYLYAIDGADGSLLAVDLSEEGAPSFGAVLPIGTGANPMRLRFGDALVTSLTILTPGYPVASDPCGELPWCGPETERSEVGPEWLRGVFLAVGLSDGTVRIVDVLDLDAPCRGTPGASAPACGEPGVEPEVYVRRHRPRLGARVVSGPTLSGTPLLTVDRVRSRLLPDGSSESGGPLRLAVWEDGCPGGSRPLYPLPQEGKPVLCVSVDPWRVRAQRWTVRWEGALPGSRGGDGVLRDGGRFEVRDPAVDLCEAGVLGSEDVPDGGDAPEVGYEGDQLEVLGEPPAWRIEERPECARFAGEGAARLRFAVRRSERHGLLLGRALGDGSLDDLARCYPDGVAFLVRARGRFVVTGSRSVPRHRVRPDGEGRCRVDPSLPTTWRLRARSDRPFDNGVVAFWLRAADGGEPLESGVDVTLTFDVGAVAPVLGVDLCEPRDRSCSSSLPAMLREAFGRLFVVDGGDRGLGGMNLRPFDLEQVFL